MMSNIEDVLFLSVAEVMDMHIREVERFGGMHGIRDLGLLESAVRTPRTTFDGQFMYKRIHEMAAAYIFHIIKNHPFLDGNKRTGCMAGLVFLRLNGINFHLSQDALYAVGMGVANSQLTKEGVANILLEVIQTDED